MTTVLMMLVAMMDGGDLLVYIHNHLPQAVCGLAAVLAPVLQVVKRYVPALKGWKALAANFALAVLGVFAVMPAGQFWTVDAWARVFAVVAASAGVYHTALSLAGKDAGSVTPPATGGIGVANPGSGPASALNTTLRDPQLR